MKNSTSVEEDVPKITNDERILLSGLGQLPKSDARVQLSRPVLIKVSSLKLLV